MKKAVEAITVNVDKVTYTPGARGPLSLVSITEELLDRKVAAPV
jgi:hypothetical protein